MSSNKSTKVDTSLALNTSERAMTLRKKQTELAFVQEKAKMYLLVTGIPLEFLSENFAKISLKGESTIVEVCLRSEGANLWNLYYRAVTLKNENNSIKILVVNEEGHIANDIAKEQVEHFKNKFGLLSYKPCDDKTDIDEACLQFVNAIQAIVLLLVYPTCFRKVLNYYEYLVKTIENKSYNLHFRNAGESLVLEIFSSKKMDIESFWRNYGSKIYNAYSPKPYWNRILLYIVCIWCLYSDNPKKKLLLYMTFLEKYQRENNTITYPLSESNFIKLLAESPIGNISNLFPDSWGKFWDFLKDIVPFLFCDTEIPYNLGIGTKFICGFKDILKLLICTYELSTDNGTNYRGVMLWYSANKEAVETRFGCEFTDQDQFLEWFYVQLYLWYPNYTEFTWLSKFIITTSTASSEESISCSSNKYRNSFWMFIIAKLTKASYNKEEWTKDFYSQFRFYLEHFYGTNFDENKFCNCLYIEISSFFPKYFDYHPVFRHKYLDQFQRITWPKSIVCDDIYKERDDVDCWKDQSWKNVFKVHLLNLYKEKKVVLLFTNFTKKIKKRYGYPSLVFNDKESDELNASTNQGTATYSFTGGGSFTQLNGVPSTLFKDWDENNQTYGFNSFKLTGCIYVDNDEELKIVVGDNAEYNINKFSKYGKDDVLCFYARAVIAYKVEIKLDSDQNIVNQVLGLNLQDLLDVLYVDSLLKK